MKVSDLTITGAERDSAQTGLIRTETTDAVNSGIVDKADKSSQALKTELFDRTSSTMGGQQEYDKTGVTGTNGSDTVSVNSKRGVDTSATGGTKEAFTTNQNSFHLHGAIATHAAANLTRDSELEGIDDVYYKGKSGVSALKSIHNRFASSGKQMVNDGSASVNQRLGQLSKKKYQAAKNTEHAQKLEQAKRNQAVSREIAKAEKARKTAWLGAGTKSSTGGAAAAGSAGASGGSGAAAAGIGLLPILLIIFLVVGIVVIVGTLSSEQKDVGTLSGNEAIVAQYLLDKGLDKLHVAAIMGNIEAESGFDPGCIEAGNGIGHGICQWSFGRWAQLQRYATSRGAQWGDINVQLDFLWAEMTGEGDAVAYTSVQYDHAGFLAINGLEDATMYWGRRFERPNEAYAHWDRRIDSARRYYAILSGANGGARIEEAQRHLGKPYVWGAKGPDSFDCSGFVYYVLNQSGYTTGYSTALGFYDRCNIISEAEAQPGDLIFFRGTYGAPNFVSHIGFYMGDGMMIHAGDPVSITSFKTEYWQSHSPEFGRLP